MQFYTALTEDLPFKTASAPIHKMMDEYDEVETQLISTWEVADFKRLNEIALRLRNGWKKQSHTAPSSIKSKELYQLIQNTNEKLLLAQSFNKDRFVAKKMSIIEQGKYDQFQFQFVCGFVVPNHFKNGGFKSVSKNISLDYPLKKKKKANLM